MSIDHFVFSLPVKGLFVFSTHFLEAVFYLEAVFLDLYIYWILIIYELYTINLKSHETLWHKAKRMDTVFRHFQFKFYFPYV